MLRVKHTSFPTQCAQLPCLYVTLLHAQRAKNLRAHLASSPAIAITKDANNLNANQFEKLRDNRQEKRWMLHADGLALFVPTRNLKPVLIEASAFASVRHVSKPLPKSVWTRCRLVGRGNFQKNGIGRPKNETPTCSSYIAATCAIASAKRLLHTLCTEHWRFLYFSTCPATESWSGIVSCASSAKTGPTPPAFPANSDSPGPTPAVLAASAT